jgi:hypothetical protein
MEDAPENKRVKRQRGGVPEHKQFMAHLPINGEIRQCMLIARQQEIHFIIRVDEVFEDKSLLVLELPDQLHMTRFTQLVSSRVQGRWQETHYDVSQLDPVHNDFSVDVHLVQFIFVMQQ